MRFWAIVWVPSRVVAPAGPDASIFHSPLDAPLFHPLSAQRISDGPIPLAPASPSTRVATLRPSGELKPVVFWRRGRLDQHKMKIVGLLCCDAQRSDATSRGRKRKVSFSYRRWTGLLFTKIRMLRYCKYSALSACLGASGRKFSFSSASNKKRLIVFEYVFFTGNEEFLVQAVSVSENMPKVRRWFSPTERYRSYSPCGKEAA